jgi:PTS system mannose-specific IIC component
LTELLALALLGGLLALDGTSVGQFMLSRPVVAGPLTGWMVGDPASGFLLGVLLELYLLVSVPSGGARFPEGATGTVVAVATASALEGPGAVPLAAAVGLVWGQLGGFTISLLRRVNARLVPEPASGATPRPARVARVHARAMALDFLRGVLVTGVGLVVGPRLGGPVAAAWPLPESSAVALLLVGGAASAGIFLRNVGGYRSRRLLFLGGLLLGLLGGRLL